MNFGKIDNYILFGGGRFLCYLAEKLKKENISVAVFSCNRHLDEYLNPLKMTLMEFLKEKQISYFNTEDINQDKEIEKYITDSTMPTK